MRLCLKVPGRAKGSAKTSFRLGAGRLDGEGLVGSGVNTQLRYSHWKPRAELPHSWAWATRARMSWDNNSLSSQGNRVRPGGGRAPQGLKYLGRFGDDTITIFYNLLRPERHRDLALFALSASWLQPAAGNWLGYLRQWHFPSITSASTQGVNKSLFNQATRNKPHTL